MGNEKIGSISGVGATSPISLGSGDEEQKKEKTAYMNSIFSGFQSQQPQASAIQA